MAVKPILFKTDMVRAILDGRKTVTRRVVSHKHLRGLENLSAGKISHSCVHPYRSGDVLWVRETWGLYHQEPFFFVYKADSDPGDEFYNDPNWKWRPSIHMPREAARIWLRVTDVRVERLQDVDAYDVVAEGAEPLIQCPNEHPVWDVSGAMIGMCWDESVCVGGCDFIGKSYEELFGKIVWDDAVKRADRERYGWAANPLVWVIEFERCEKPEG